MKSFQITFVVHTGNVYYTAAYVNIATYDL